MAGIKKTAAMRAPRDTPKAVPAKPAPKHFKTANDNKAPSRPMARGRKR